jgi:nucleoside phosphorylase
MRSPASVADEAVQHVLTGLRRPAIFLHFFDVHFLEEKGVDRFLGQAIAEARLATRLAVLLADDVLVPASSRIESDLCKQVLLEFPHRIFADHFTMVGSGASFEEFIEEKRSQYRADQAQGIAYREAGIGIDLPWRTRRRSATADIATDWKAALPSGAAESLFKALHGTLPKDVERLWEGIPERLGASAFIVENVIPLLLDTPSTGLIVRNRLHGIVNKSYFGSYGKDICGSVFRHMRFLESPDTIPSGDPTNDLDFQRLVASCRDTGILKDIVKARPPTLLTLRDDPRLAAAYAMAHPAPLSPTGGERNGPTWRGHVTGDGMKGEDKVADNGPRVLIVTALPREAAAVLATFDEWSDAPGHAHDPNVYREGGYRMTDGKMRKVLLASLPIMGTDMAATVATNAFRTHPRIGYALMVGIAGACPNPDRAEEHVRLGDVVVSDAKGVFDYGHVKRTPGGDENRGSHQRVSGSLLGIFGMLSSEELLGRRPWEAILDSTLANPEASWRFRRPGDDKDVLHRFVDGKAEVIPHPEDADRRPGHPRLHGGAIGTADILLKEPDLRDELRDRYAVRAVEMEGSGMQTASWLSGREFIVVRGTCDYADPTKNNDWQHYAALAAASVARSMVERMPDEWFA